MTRTAPFLIACLAHCLACSSGSRLPPPTPPAATALAGSQEAAPQVPLRVTWRVLSDSGGRLVVEAVVERFAQLGATVAVSVRVPQGLTLLAGKARFDVEADGRTGETVQPFEFSYVGAPPLEDLELRADLDGAGMGIHAGAKYQFGRLPKQAKPAATGPAVKIGDRDFGASIPLDTPK